MKRRKKVAQTEEIVNGFEAWGGYMEAKKSKLLEQFKGVANNITNKQSNIFKGISVFVNGYTKPSAEEIKHIMALHGGVYHHYHSSSKTTYIITSNLPDTKIKQLGPSQKVIKPEWITDCLLSGKLLDFTKYLLYTNCNRQQPKLNFDKIVKEEAVADKIICNAYKNDDCQLSPDIFESDDDDTNVNNNERQISNNNIVNNSSDLQNTTNYSRNKSDFCTNFKVSEPKNENNVGKSTRTLTANDPKFLIEFYNNSRLHHISTLGATFKQYVCDLREQSNFKFTERQKLVDYAKGIRRVENTFSSSEKQTVIMHIDMDCFFVSVGLRKRPDLKGIPVAVTHSKGGQGPTLRSGVDRQAELECYKQRMQEKFKLKNVDLGPGNMSTRLEGIGSESMSEIASCSYEARKAGVKNGMFMGTALKLCPNLQTIQYDFDGYKEVAYSLYNTISEYTLNIEPVSCDEMFVDITELLKDTNVTVNEWATYIRSLIQKRTGCPCSTGFGKNRLQARMATRTAKPNGQFHLISEAVEEYMIDIKVDDLPGVGRSHSLKLESLGIKTCGELQSMTIKQLRSEFGNKIGETLYNHCRGIDDRPLIYEHERKSVSAEINYGIRFKSNTEAESFLKQLASEVHARLTEIKMKGKCITLKLMIRSKDAPQESSKYMGHGICDYITKSNSLSTSTNELIIIEREILFIAQKLAVPPEELRGIGIQISKLEKIKNSNLFGGITKFFNPVNTKKITENNYQTLNKINSTECDNLNKNIENSCNEKQKLELSVNKDTVLIEESMKVEKSSPIKNNHINTIKRGRGRSRGRGGKTIERKSSNNGNLTKYFNNPTPSTSTVQIQKEDWKHEIDMEVFEALPEDIQKEILEQYQVRKKNMNTNNNYKDNKDKEIITVNLTEENEKKNKQIVISEKTSKIKVISNENKLEKNNMFYNMDIKMVKSVVEDWVSTENSPELCDIKMLGEYLKELALNKKIEDLFMMLKFVFRFVWLKHLIPINKGIFDFSEISFKNTCGWHKAYFEVVNSAQEGMYARYGSKIWTYKDFKCKNKCHLQDR